MNFLSKIVAIAFSIIIPAESFAARQSVKIEPIPNEVATRLATDTDIIDTTLYNAPDGGENFGTRAPESTELGAPEPDGTLDENEPSAPATRQRKALGALRPALTQDGTVAFDQGKFSTDDYRDAIAGIVGVHQSLLTQAGKHPGFRRDEAIKALHQERSGHLEVLNEWDRFRNDEKLKRLDAARSVVTQARTSLEEAKSNENLGKLTMAAGIVATAGVGAIAAEIEALELTAEWLAGMAGSVFNRISGEQYKKAEQSDLKAHALMQGKPIPPENATGLPSIFSNAFHSLVKAGISEVAPFEAKILGHVSDLYSFLSRGNNRYRREHAMAMTEESAKEIIVQWENRARALLRREIKSRRAAPSAARARFPGKRSTPTETLSEK